MNLQESTDFGGLRHYENHAGFATESQGVTALAPIEDRSAIIAACDALRMLQRQRQFCITSQSRCDRSCESFIARVIGYNPDADEKSRKAVFKQASDIRKSVEKGDGGGGLISGDNHHRVALSAVTPIILNSAIARKAWDALRENTEKEMRKIAKTLPAYGWVASVRGFGDLGFAIIIGETGDLANYATKERVWKRLGLAVIEGQKQGRRSNAEEAAKHGYSPKRRAEVWTIVDSLFRAVWRGAKEVDGLTVPAHALSVYGTVYARRKAYTVVRTTGPTDWTPAHRENDARRLLGKSLVEDLWRVWNGKEALSHDAPP